MSNEGTLVSTTSSALSFLNMRDHQDPVLAGSVLTGSALTGSTFSIFVGGRVATFAFSPLKSDMVHIIIPITRTQMTIAAKMRFWRSENRSRARPLMVRFSFLAGAEWALVLVSISGWFCWVESVGSFFSILELLFFLECVVKIRTFLYKSQGVF
jgi:hypothetical protein